MDGLYIDMKRLLVESGMEAGEARAIALLLLERVGGLTTAEALAGKETDKEAEERMRAMTKRVAKGEPVQYVMGEAEFCGLWLRVESGVLIPRKETEELVEWAIEEGGLAATMSQHRESERDKEGGEGEPPLRVLDIGTGSGCIAVALAHGLPQAQVEAWDVSEAALCVAKENAGRCGVEVKVRRVDVLEGTEELSGRDRLERLERLEEAEEPPAFDIIVSNPPYICQSEASAMERNVLQHEPHVALFVPDEDPLLFYRRIATLGQNLLKEGGRLLFEINRRFGRETVAMLEAMGYEEVELRKDQFGNDRMVKAIKRQVLRF